jgi:hypothetical protein
LAAVNVAHLLPSDQPGTNSSCDAGVRDLRVLRPTRHGGLLLPLRGKRRGRAHECARRAHPARAQGSSTKHPAAGSSRHSRAARSCRHCCAVNRSRACGSGPLLRLVRAECHARLLHVLACTNAPGQAWSVSPPVRRVHVRLVRPARAAGMPVPACWRLGARCTGTHTCTRTAARGGILP